MGLLEDKVLIVIPAFCQTFSSCLGVRYGDEIWQSRFRTRKAEEAGLGVLKAITAGRQ